MISFIPLVVRYRIGAFVAGFVLMTYELAGARILTPVIGSSAYVWTSIIGVIIAALSIGYIIGGFIADKRARVSDLGWLFVATALSATSTFLFIDIVAETLAHTHIDVRLEAVIASTLLFAPTSVLLGSLSPYIVKLHTVSLQTTGRSVATLSALNSLGGIAGTFLTGFVFFGYIGSRQTLGGLIILLAVASLLFFEKLSIKFWIIVLAMMTSGLLLPVGGNKQNVIAVIDTPMASYEVTDIPTKQNRTVRVLTMGPDGYQSGMYRDNPHELAFPYAQRIAEIVARHQPRRILVLGGGTLTLPSYLATAHPDSLIDVVEIDRKLTDVAQQYFMYHNPANVKIINQDARAYLNQADTFYDVVVIDVFSDSGVPFTFTTREFAQLLAAQTAPGAMVVMNIIAGDTPACSPLLSAVYRSFTLAFSEVFVAPVSYRTLDKRQNILLIASQTEQPSYPLLAKQRLAVPPGTATLSDNYSPIERLHHQCLEE